MSWDTVLSFGANIHLRLENESTRKLLSSTEMLTAPSRWNYASSLETQSRFSLYTGSMYLVIADDTDLNLKWKCLWKMRWMVEADGALMSAGRLDCRNLYTDCMVTLWMPSWSIHCLTHSMITWLLTLTDLWSDWGEVRTEFNLYSIILPLFLSSFTAL